MQSLLHVAKRPPSSHWIRWASSRCTSSLRSTAYPSTSLPTGQLSPGQSSLRSLSTYLHPVSDTVTHDTRWPNEHDCFTKCHPKELPPPQEWTTYHGKLSVLKEASKEQEPEPEHEELVKELFHGKIPILASATSSAATKESGDDANSGSASPDATSSGSSPQSGIYGGGGRLGPRTCILMELTDRVGVLYSVLQHFNEHKVNICRIESRPATKDVAGTTDVRFDFFVDLQGSPSDPNVADLLKVLETVTNKLLVLDEEKQVQWFPRHVSELDLIVHRTVDAGDDLESDHPGFQDAAYRTRRAELAQAAREYTWDRNSIPKIPYSEAERSVWTAVWDKMENLWDQYACREYRTSLQLMMDHCGYTRDNIPQQQDISNFLWQTTQFQLRPVAGLLSSRDFLNGLAFRVFFCTQYIRHSSRPLYTPEPDICHELLGHAPMFADADFADFSQEIGLASLGASDEDILKLARCYWFSVEFGLVTENDKRKAYGAGLLSSFGELEYACGEGDDASESTDKSDEGLEQQQRPEFKPWDPHAAALQEFPITTYQPVYFVAPSLQDVKVSMRHYCQDLPRPFYAQYNSQTETVHIDRPVKRTQGVPSA